MRDHPCVWGTDWWADSLTSVRVPVFRALRCEEGPQLTDTGALAYGALIARPAVHTLTGPLPRLLPGDQALMRMHKKSNNFYVYKT